MVTTVIKEATDGYTRLKKEADSGRPLSNIERKMLVMEETLRKYPRTNRK